MPHIASLPIITTENNHRCMVDTGGIFELQCVYPLNYPNPPQQLTIFGQNVNTTRSPWGRQWEYNDHRAMFNDQHCGEGQAFDFILGYGWLKGKIISLNRNGATLAKANVTQSPNIEIMEGGVVMITIDGESYLFDSGIPFSLKFAEVGQVAGTQINDNNYQLAYSPVAGGALKIQTQEDDDGIYWATACQNLNPNHNGQLERLAHAIQHAGGNGCVGFIGSDYLRKNEVVIDYRP